MLGPLWRLLRCLEHSASPLGVPPAAMPLARWLRVELRVSGVPRRSFPWASPPWALPCWCLDCTACERCQGGLLISARARVGENWKHASGPRLCGPCCGSRDAWDLALAGCVGQHLLRQSNQCRRV